MAYRELDKRVDAELLANISDWPRTRNCADKDVDTSWFYPDDRAQPHKAVFSLCDTCEIRATCAEYALTNDESQGIWGGLVAAERKKILFGRRYPTEKNPSCRTPTGPSVRGYRTHLEIGEDPCDGCRAHYRAYQVAYYTQLNVRAERVARFVANTRE